MTPRQREKTLDYLRRVPMGLLIIVGAAGTGKPTWISRLDNEGRLDNRVGLTARVEC